METGFKHILQSGSPSASTWRGRRRAELQFMSESAVIPFLNPSHGKVLGVEQKRMAMALALALAPTTVAACCLGLSSSKGATVDVVNNRSRLRGSLWGQNLTAGNQTIACYELRIVCSSRASEDKLKKQDEVINIKVEKLDGNTRRAARKAVATVLQVDRARLLDVDKISRTSARLLPRAILEALSDRIRARHWQSALKVFGLLRLQEWYDPKEEIYIKLLRMLGKCKVPDVASDLFQMMIEDDKIIPSVEALTALLSVYMKSNRISTAFRLFAHMKKLPEYQPDVYTYSLMIKGCCEGGLFDEGSHLLSEMLQSGVEPNTVTYNTLIDAFGKVGMLSQMEELLGHILETGTCKPDTWTYNIIIKHYGKQGNIQRMEDWFEVLQATGVQPDTITFNTLIWAYGRNGLYAEMKSVLIYMRKYLYYVDQVTYNSLIEAYGRGGMIDEMRKTFSAMKRAGVKFTAFTLCCLISAYSKKKIWEEVEKVKRQWKNSDLVPDVALYNSLIHAYRMAGTFDEMQATFSEMKNEGLIPDEITYSILIDAYNSQQMEEKAAQLLGEMRSMQIAEKIVEPEV